MTRGHWNGATVISRAAGSRSGDAVTGAGGKAFKVGTGVTLLEGEFRVSGLTLLRTWSQ